MAATKNGAKRLAELAGAPPRMATVDDLQAAGVPHASAHAKQRSSKKPMGINLKAVAEALVDAGMDPAVEIINILQKQVPVRDINGKPRVDPATKKPLMADAIDADTKLRMLNEMLQYTQPKLKSVEMKVSGQLELTNEQLDSRLTMLLSRAVSK
tara:strand:- start:220 stop:684 length:465 start_codon:yes stop_codon:yes gene_type:complete